MSSPLPSQTLLTPREAAQRLRISPKHFYAHYLHNPQSALIVIERAPQRYLIDAASLDREIQRLTIRKEHIR